MNFNYYFGTQADQFSFIRIPKTMLVDEKFSVLSIQSKMLYGLLLDRMGLSMKNHWLDEENRVYIIYQISEIMEDLGFSKKKAIDHLAELEAIGLVEKRRRGLGLPSILYVKSFIAAEKNTDDGGRGSQTDTSVNGDGTAENRGTETETSRSVEKGISRSAEIDTSRGAYLGTSRSAGTVLQEVHGGEPLKNNTKDNHIYGSDIESNLIIFDKPPDGMDSMPQNVEAYQELIKSNIAYDALVADHPHDIDTIDGIVRLILETVISTREYILISGDKRPATLVKKQMMRLGYEHIEYVLSSMAANTTDVRNIRQYLLAALYNAPNTIDSFYQAKVNHDFPQYAAH